MSTLGGAQCSGGYHEYTGRCSVQWGYHEYSGGFSTLGETMSTLGGYHDEYGGYHEYTRGYSVHWGFHTNSVVFPMTFPHIFHNILQCTHDILPVY